MIRRKGKYHSHTSFLDLLFNTLVGFVMLFIIAFLLISPIKKKKDIEQKAEYVITVTWPNGKTQTITKTPVNQTLELVEPIGK